MFRETIAPEEIEALELTAFPGRIHIITTQQQCAAAVKHLSAQRLIGFDTETRPTFTPNAPRSKTALLQLSSESDAFLFRLNAIGLPHSVAAILSDSGITKIGAAVMDDIYGLRRHTDFVPRRFMDLQNFADKYGISDKSVKKLTAIILGKRISKAQQCSNWEAENLSEAQQLYAATDAWICLKMYKELLSHPYAEK